MLHTFGGVELMQATYTRITTDSLTSAYKTYQVGAVPTGTTFPYVTLGGLMGGKSADFTSRDIRGEDLVIYLHVWSSVLSDSEAGNMMDNCIQALTATDLSLTGYTTLKGIADFQQILVDDSNATQLLRHGVIRMRYQVA